MYRTLPRPIRLLRFGAVITIGLAALTACGGTPDVTPVAAAPTTTVAPTPTPTPTPTPSATLTPVATPQPFAAVPPPPVPKTPVPRPATPKTAAPQPPAAPQPAVAPQPAPKPEGGSSGNGSAYYANCDAVRAAGKAPLLKGQPGYRPGLDRDNDDKACEPEGT